MMPPGGRLHQGDDLTGDPEEAAFRHRAATERSSSISAVNSSVSARSLVCGDAARSSEPPAE
jgi:hypothetical protein